MALMTIPQRLSDEDRKALVRECGPEFADRWEAYLAALEGGAIYAEPSGVRVDVQTLQSRLAAAERERDEAGLNQRRAEEALRLQAGHAKQAEAVLQDIAKIAGHKPSRYYCDCACCKARKYFGVPPTMTVYEPDA